MTRIFLLLMLVTSNIHAMQHNSRIFVAGHTGLVGSAICKALQSYGYQNLILRSSHELNLCNQIAVEDFFEKEKPEYVFLAAAKVGGIQANIDYPAQFIYENLMIQNNVIHAAYKYGVKKLLFLGSSCIYPRDCPQPIKEEYLMTSPLEKSNEFYALAKIAGLKMCQAYNKQYNTNFISCMPTNLYGPGDNFNLTNSHVIPALIRKIYEAKINNLDETIIWGTGNAMREFLYVDDLAEAAIFLMQNYNENIPINIGTGNDISIKELVNILVKIIGFEGKIIFDKSKPDGTPRKLLDTSLINKMGWKPKTDLLTGIKKTFEWYVENKSNTRK